MQALSVLLLLDPYRSSMEADWTSVESVGRLRHIDVINDERAAGIAEASPGEVARHRSNGHRGRHHWQTQSGPGWL